MSAEAEKVFLLPGEYYVSRTDCEIATLLGSCVAVCLKNDNKPYAAMNHYLLPENLGNDDSEKGRYGNSSIDTIIWLLQKLDPRGRLTAKIYGGGAVVGYLGGSSDIGTRNILKAREILKAKNIPILEEDVGGVYGRRIYFDTFNNKVTVKVIKKTEEALRLEEKRRDLASRKTRVLIVDDSPLVRKILSQAVASTTDLEVCGEAADAFEARDMILNLNPDVVSLDIIMPKLDGLKFLKSLSQHFPKPVVICSTIAKDKSQVAARARDYGAVEVVDKDTLELYRGFDVLRDAYIPKLRRAANVVVKKMMFDS